MRAIIACDILIFNSKEYAAAGIERRLRDLYLLSRPVRATRPRGRIALAAKEA
jgi:hypothetical protein